jgi:hypothetical protein
MASTEQYDATEKLQQDFRNWFCKIRRPNISDRDERLAGVRLHVTMTPSFLLSPPENVFSLISRTNANMNMKLRNRKIQKITDEDKVFRISRLEMALTTSRTEGRMWNKLPRSTLQCAFVDAPSVYFKHRPWPPE